jgi:hypothetical protein
LVENFGDKKHMVLKVFTGMTVREIRVYQATCVYYQAEENAWPTISEETAREAFTSMVKANVYKKQSQLTTAQQIAELAAVSGLSYSVAQEAAEHELSHYGVNRYGEVHAVPSTTLPGLLPEPASPDPLWAYVQDRETSKEIKKQAQEWDDIRDATSYLKADHTDMRTRQEVLQAAETMRSEEYNSNDGLKIRMTVDVSELQDKLFALEHLVDGIKKGFIDREEGIQRMRELHDAIQE